MNTDQKQDLIQQICTLLFDHDVAGHVTATPAHLEDGSERGFLRTLCGRGWTREAAIDDLFDKMRASTRLVRNASESRMNFLWHDVPRKFIEIG
jgi:hypothetical protein